MSPAAAIRPVVTTTKVVGRKDMVQAFSRSRILSSRRNFNVRVVRGSATHFGDKEVIRLEFVVTTRLVAGQSRRAEIT